MKKKDILIFGCDEYAMQIAQNLKDRVRSMRLYTRFEEKVPLLEAQGYDVRLFELDENWDDLANFDQHQVFAFCALCDEANNIFLTLSLRTMFESMVIIALASDQENANKLKIAGANKAIVTAQVATNVIYELLDKPLTLDMLHELLYEDQALKIEQITVSKESTLVGQRFGDIDFRHTYNVIALAIMDEALKSDFIFNKAGLMHEIKADEVIVLLGYESDLENFQKEVGEHYETGWHQWGW